MTTAVTTEDINELLGLFQQLEALLRPELPAKSNELWEESLEQAKQELAEDLKRWQCGFTLRPGGNNRARKSSKAKQKEIQAEYESRVTEIAEKKYYAKDPTYAKAVDEAKSQTDEVLKSIDHLLLAIRQPLLQFPRVQDSPLAVDWKKHIRNYYPFLDKDNLSYQVREGIDVLQALKLQFERQQRKEIESQQYHAEPEQKAQGSKIMITARTSKENWEAIRSEYDISKKDFGKKINFVSDSFKRKIIFRDVEHAFVLASQGFSKPALIIAGGVIEELLRLYLEHKKIEPKCEKFFSYIEACEDNGLLKRGVSRLTDSIRDFRNLVHLKNEETNRHTVSKATAKGAVSSIFTIANDFQ